MRVVLVHPEIPPNTGAIARTCAATETELHLVEPLGFEISDRYLKRAGLDYWPYVNLTVHSDWDAFLVHAEEKGGRLIAFSTRGASNYWDENYLIDDWLVFGKETAGLTGEQIDRCTTCVKIPMTQPKVRSLNLSVSVALGVFEARRQVFHQAQVAVTN